MASTQDGSNDPASRDPTSISASTHPSYTVGNPLVFPGATSASSLITTGVQETTDPDVKSTTARPSSSSVPNDTETRTFTAEGQILSIPENLEELEPPTSETTSWKSSRVITSTRPSRAIDSSTANSSTRTADTSRRTSSLTSSLTSASHSRSSSTNIPSTPSIIDNEFSLFSSARFLTSSPREGITSESRSASPSASSLSSISASSKITRYSSSSLPYLPTGLLPQGPASATSSSSPSVADLLIPAAPTPSSAMSTDQDPSPAPISSPAGTPSHKSDVKAVVSGTTLTGSAAVSAIAAGAVKVDELRSNEIKKDGEGKLGTIAIIGIVAGIVAALVIIGTTWYKIAKKSKSKDAETEEDLNEKAKDEEADGYDFNDDPVTASTGRIRRYTVNNVEMEGQGPFDDRYQSKYGSGSWYQGDDNYHPGAGRVGDYGSEDGLRQTYVDEYRSFTPSGPLPQPAINDLHNQEVSSAQYVTNPFAPPIPPGPVPTKSPNSTNPSHYSRPITGAANAYTSYRSRPATEYDSERSQLPVQTPATSSLLPWLNRPRTPASQVPVMPSTSQMPPAGGFVSRPQNSKILPRTTLRGRYTQYESNAAGVGARKAAAPAVPVRPAMAQTPAGAHANTFEGVIPGFR